MYTRVIQNAPDAVVRSGEPIFGDFDKAQKSVPLDKSEVDRRVCDGSCLIDDLSGIRKQVDAFAVMKNMLIVYHNGNLSSITDYFIAKILFFVRNRETFL